MDTDHVTINFTSPEELEGKFATALRARGWICIQPEKEVWVTPASVCATRGIPPATLSKRLHSHNAPRFPKKTSITGRIYKLVLTPDLEAFLAGFVNKSETTLSER